MPADSPAVAPAMPTMGFPELYERFLVPPLFAPWAGQLLDRLPLGSAASLLDVGCGTGIVGRLALARVGRSLRVVGLDRNPAMLEVARGAAPEVDWREGDATNFTLDANERFDTLTCHQVLQFVGDKAGAIARMRRALVPGGHIAIGVWRALEEYGVFNDLGQIAERFVGPIADVRHSFADAQALESLLASAGFNDIRVEQVALDARFDEPETLARLNAAAVVGMSATGKAMTEDERTRTVADIVAASKEVLLRYGGSTIYTTTSANLATAVA